MEQELPKNRPTWRMRIQNLLVTGLLVLTPVTLTLFVIQKLFVWLDGIFAPLVVRATGRHFPGLGVLLTLTVILLLGWLSTNVLGRQLITVTERIVARIPVARTIYSATKGVVDGLSKKHADAFKRVVMVEYPRRGMFALAFVTNSVRWPHYHERTADAVLVFLPTTPNPTSGYLLIVPRDEVVDLPISVEDGIRIVISGGILLDRGERGSGERSS